MTAFLGFMIAMAVGLTGIGGGSLTVPALVLIAGLPAAEAVGTAFVFAAVLRVIAMPVYLVRRQFHARYLWLVLLGAVPGLVIGTFLLRKMNHQAGAPVVIVVLGILLVLTASVTFLPKIQDQKFMRKNSRWLPWLAFPIGVESGFSSAGAGALGAALFLNYSEMLPAEVIGTDLMFGFVLSVVGSIFHWQIGSVQHPVLLQLLAGGIPGVLLGCILTGKAPAKGLKRSEE